MPAHTIALVAGHDYYLCAHTSEGDRPRADVTDGATGSSSSSSSSLRSMFTRRQRYTESSCKCVAVTVFNLYPHTAGVYDFYKKKSHATHSVWCYVRWEILITIRAINPSATIPECCWWYLFRFFVCLSRIRVHGENRSVKPGRRRLILYSSLNR